MTSLPKYGVLLTPFHPCNPTVYPIHLSSQSVRSSASLSVKSIRPSVRPARASVLSVCQVQSIRSFPSVRPSIVSSRSSPFVHSAQSVCPFVRGRVRPTFHLYVRLFSLSVCPSNSSVHPINPSVCPFDQSIRPVRPPVHLIRPFVCLICQSGGLKQIRNGDIFKMNYKFINLQKTIGVTILCKFRI